jgi:hypothetical protein
MLIKALPSRAFLEKEPGLLTFARANRPTFPLDTLDVLIIDEMGKNISGVGMDTHIIGRMKIAGQAEPSSPRIRSIIVTDLTDESHGNATGVGLADIITRRLYNKINFDITYKNIITSSFLERGKIPVVAGSDREALEWAIRNCGAPSQGKERIVRIKNTLRMSELYVSGPIWEMVKDNPSMEILGPPVPLFDDKNQLTAF